MVLVARRETTLIEVGCSIAKDFEVQYRVIVMDLSQGGFVPMLAEYKDRRGAEEAKVLVDRTATMLTLALLAVTVLGVALAPVVIYLSAPGFSADAG